MPISDRLVPLHTTDEPATGRVGARCHGPALDVGDGLLVHCDQACARTCLDGHIAQSHSALHAERADRRAAELDGVTSAARCAYLADDGQHNVLSSDALGGLAVDLHQHVLGFFGQQCLRSQNMFNLGGADAVRERAERAVRGGVRVAADHGHAGQGGAVLRTDDVHDALPLGHEREVGRGTELAHVVVQRGDLRLADGVGDAVVAELPARGRRVVVCRGDDRADAPDWAFGNAQTFKGLRAGDLVDEVAVYVEHRRAVVLGVDDVLVPDLVV